MLDGPDALTPWMPGIQLACVAAVAPGLAWRSPDRGTMAHAGTPARLSSGNGG